MNMKYGHQVSKNLSSFFELSQGHPLTESPVNALIFDLDGTLVDTLGGIENAINCALRLHGLAPLGTQEVSDRIGRGGTALVEYGLQKAGQEVTPARVVQLQDSYFEAYLSAPTYGTRVLPGVIPMLKRASAQGVELAVCTNKNSILAAAVLDGLSLTNYFRHLVYGDSLLHRKPHPGPIEWIVKQLGVPAETCVMVGDTEYDMCAARSSGVRSIFVNFGYSRPEYLTSQPDWVIDHFDNLKLTLRNPHQSSSGCPD